MDAIPLPPRPDLAQYRRQAKDLLRAARAGDPAASQHLHQCPRLRRRLPATTGTPPYPASERRDGPSYALADALYVVARDHGFASWPRFAAHAEALQHRDASVARFEAAADAVVSGDVAALTQFLRADPALVRARSTRAHRATLLHYVAANGVEDFRQRTPPQAVAIARTLVVAGAAVDVTAATAATYGGGPQQTPLTLLVSSVHPARAGLQVALVDSGTRSGRAFRPPRPLGACGGP